MEPRVTGDAPRPEATGMEALEEQKLIRGRKRRRQEEMETGELNIVPYLDIVTNLVMFLLQVTSVAVSLGEVQTRLPPTGAGAEVSEPPPPDEKPPLRLTVVVGERGYTVAGAEAVLTGGAAADPSGGPTIPKLGNNEYDYASLTKLMVKVKAAFPKERQAFIVPEDMVQYGSLVSTMDAMRENGPDLLFPDVMFAGF